MAKHRVIAIDGPAASGKTTVSRQVARALGFAFVSSGQMYRVFTGAVCQAGVDPRDEESVGQLLGRVRLALIEREDELFLTVGEEAGDLASEEINRAVSHVAKIPAVREVLLAKQRETAERADIVMEGRDIGSVVFPDTPYKFYLDASPEVRQQRRASEGGADAIAERDRLDSQRKHSPLTVAEGAIVVDTSHLSLPEVVAAVLTHLRALGLKPSQ